MPENLPEIKKKGMKEGINYGHSHEEDGTDRTLVFYGVDIC